MQREFVDMAYYFIVIENLVLIVGIIGTWFYKKETSSTLKSPKLYADYLNSKKWEDLRKKALERSDYHCELCNNPYQAVHHVKYPKKYKNDHIDNLVVVCDRCHAKLHGIRDEIVPYQKEEVIDFVEKYENLYTEKIKIGNHSYYFDVIGVTQDKKYLQITEIGKREEQKIEVSADEIEIFYSKITLGLSLLKNKKNVSFKEDIVIANSRYFFEIKYAINNSRYLKITQSKQKEKVVFESVVIVIFEDCERYFSLTLQKAVDFMQNAI